MLTGPLSRWKGEFLRKFPEFGGRSTQEGLIEEERRVTLPSLAMFLETSYRVSYSPAWPRTPDLPASISHVPGITEHHFACYVAQAALLVVLPQPASSTCKVCVCMGGCLKRYRSKEKSQSQALLQKKKVCSSTKKKNSCANYWEGVFGWQREQR